MSKKIIFILKCIIIAIISCILIKMWNKKDIVLNYILSNSSDKAVMLLKPIYTIGIIIFLLCILVGTIYILFKRRNFIHENFRTRFRYRERSTDDEG